MTPPNILIILTDDQGYHDLSCMGNMDFRTPHLDALAASGARFTDWYACSPVCSPSRAALLTGRFPGNAGVRSILGAHRRYASGLPRSVPTLARALKPLGYDTYLAGKWHLGAREGYRPQDHGFDHWFGFLAGCVDYYSHIYYWGVDAQGHPVNALHDLWDDGVETWADGRYLTEVITERAIADIRRSTAARQPFFLYIGYNAPHYPMHAPQPYLDRFPHLPWERRIMAAMLSAVDDGVGQIVAELERQGQRENTLIVFMSDNGPSRETRNWLDGSEAPYCGGSVGALRGHKFSLYDGGVRVPGIIAYPARIPGGRVEGAPCTAADVFPTALRLAGGEGAGYETDGIDLLPSLSGEQPFPLRHLFWEYEEQTAVRYGDWKLVLNGRDINRPRAGDSVHLANLADDIGEARNLADAHPDIARELTAAAQQWRAGIEARWASEWRNGATELIEDDVP
jgi:arylsulfatase A-like enzyme